MSGIGATRLDHPVPTLPSRACASTPRPDCPGRERGYDAETVWVGIDSTMNGLLAGIDIRIVRTMASYCNDIAEVDAFCIKTSCFYEIKTSNLLLCCQNFIAHRCNSYLLTLIEAATPRPMLVAALLPHYPKGDGRGRPPIGACSKRTT